MCHGRAKCYAQRPDEARGNTGDFGFANHFEETKDDLMQMNCGSP